MMEAPPCRRCGSTKTGSARHGFLYNIAHLLGYRLRLCGGCRRLRLVARTPAAEPEVIRTTEVKTLTSTPPNNSPACPYCGSTDFRRSRRRWYDYLLKRPKMARCRTCRRRFPSRYIPRAQDNREMQKSA
jgi:hypothetical protein